MTLWSLFNPTQFSFARIPRFRWNSSVAIRVAPLSIVYMCIIIFNPLFLQHVEVTTYHFSHSLSIAFSLIFSFYMLQIEHSGSVNSACVVIMLGLCVCSMGSLNFSVAGAFYAVAWPAVVSIYGIYLKKTLTALKNDVWALIQYNTILSLATLTPLVILSGELKSVLNEVWFLDETGFWIQMIITSLTGFAVNVIMVLLILYTSPLTLVVASINKTILQAFLATLLFGNPMSLMNVVGMLVSLTGTCYYIYTRYNEFYS
ncbi:hypothetical protein G6F57_007470 [Rhizopus arrhizus]|uniref:Sugar phosphate transporter domain-containing protein n=1 Tax=Rhizopus oryzae TaxID=64495 RepID=A0A9P7BQV5_RHIOR|nr:hypothetical protein G6F23_007473 [Rhizopus arrhizus]KAG1416731.1 hypothetical protein G6F58_005832 [Rhizopus delemar]KAG0767618.1 hypothetical protein G6F24_002637 [Rhizopus arrhizus]KAG0788409.1 hypothetical protein G6F21_007232 [Rhizopus arrhizus]KAG0793077.1 hypothetical protein G6F22_005699 [Rhizopus arrhizus]